MGRGAIPSGSAGFVTVVSELPQHPGKWAEGRKTAKRAKNGFLTLMFGIFGANLFTLSFLCQ